MPDRINPIKNIRFRNSNIPLFSRNTYIRKTQDAGYVTDPLTKSSIALVEEVEREKFDDRDESADMERLDIEALPSMGEEVTTFVTEEEPSIYSEAVIEELLQMPRLADTNVEVIPQFFADSLVFDESRDNTYTGEPTEEDRRAFAELKGTFNMANVNQSLTELMEIEGAMAVAVVDAKSGMALGSAGGGVNLDVAAAGNSEVVKAKMKVMANLGLKDKIEDILITLGSQYHLIRPTSASPTIFVYLVLNRAQANLAMARHKLSLIETEMQI